MCPKQRFHLLCSRMMYTFNNREEIRHATRNCVIAGHVHILNRRIEWFLFSMYSSTRNFSEFIHIYIYKYIWAKCYIWIEGKTLGQAR